MQMPSYLVGLISVSVATIALSTAGLMTRLIDMDSATLLFWRGTISGVFLLVCLIVVRGRSVYRDFASLGLSGLAICVASAVSASFFIAALHETTVAHVAIIFATCPFAAAGLGFLMLGERPGRGALAASGIALTGVVLMIGQGGEGSIFGDLLAFAMTFTIALWTVLVRRYPDKPVLACSVLSTLLSAAFAAPFAAPLATSSEDLMVVLLFAIFGFSLGVVLLIVGSRLLPPVEAALIGAMDAPLAPLWVWLFVGEVPSGPTMVGGSVVLAAVGLHVVATTRQNMRARTA
ncbi:DMT family transporter [Rhizobium sp. S95]|uniref:DMT family transporter n=1 Tax=Ciceribacter sichuanensis TaxID=2949647 RepID=A0AAJ1BVY4_9HYPH|nr:MULTISPECIES: DMT family transporter [unclassified Ciceribacter]MCM2398628.1 DMT family transporter [Ciceribacter sp. S95]MCO5957166.1 DMT family transporter [Ciceribacter sp. S101]